MGAAGGQRSRSLRCISGCAARWYRNLCVVEEDESPAGWFAVDGDETMLLGEVSLPTCLP